MNKFVDPRTGCDAISDEGRCYSYFTHTGINWNDARRQCLAWGGDLATFTSPEEYALMHGTITQGKYCYIGFNDIDKEGTWVWADGDTSTYTKWRPGEPNNNYGVGAQNCGWTWYNGLVDDVWCTYEASCYFCSKIGKFMHNIVVQIKLTNLWVSSAKRPVCAACSALPATVVLLKIFY